MKTAIYILVILIFTTANIVFAQESPYKAPYDSIGLDTIYTFTEVEPADSTEGNGGFANRNNTLFATDLGDIQVYFDPTGDPQSEPHLTINKNHPNNIIISANCYDHAQPSGCPYTQSIYVNNNYNQSALGWSHFKVFPNSTCTTNVIGVGGDPSTAVDEEGRLFVSTMYDASRYNYKVNKSTNLGTSWTGLIDGNASTLPQNYAFDKEMMVADNLPFSPYVGNIYCAWSASIGMTNPRTYAIKFNRSTNHGTSFDTPITLFPVTGHGVGSGTNVQTGPDGEVYVSWTEFPDDITTDDARTIDFATSINGGSSFSAYANITSTFDYPAIQTTTGAGQTEFGNTRVFDYPTMAVDRSCGPYRGRIYIAYNLDVGRPTATKSRILVIYSDDDGVNWNTCNSEDPIDIDANQNWMPWIAVDDANGIVCVAYLSMNNNIANYTTDTYLAYSDDGGETFSNIRVSDVSHIHGPISPPYFGGYAGDYIAVDAYGGNAYVAWPDNRNGAWNIYCSTIQFSGMSTISSQGNLNPNVSLDFSNNQGSFTYRAANTITATVNQVPFSISAGSTVTFQAGEEIHFTPGFSALSGSTFHAFISSVNACSSPFRMANYGSNITSTESEATINFLNVFPNPFFTTLDIIYIIDRDEKIKILLYDAYGREVFNILTEKNFEAGKYNIKVNLPDFSAGIYYLDLQTESKKTVRKIVKL